VVAEIHGLARLEPYLARGGKRISGMERDRPVTAAPRQQGVEPGQGRGGDVVDLTEGVGVGGLDEVVQGSISGVATGGAAAVIARA
jgi:hypothetical protein